MSVRVVGEPGPLEISFAWEESSLHERVALPDVLSARAFLARLSGRGHALTLRRLLDSSPGRVRDDGEVLSMLAAMIARGRLIVRRGAPVPLPAFDTDEEEAAPAARGPSERPPAPEVEAPAPLEALPPASVDAVLQAAVLRRAAEKGVPFCEECERKARQKKVVEDDTSHLDQRAMARTLVRAAAEGAPVCEECERHKKEPPPPPPPDDEDDEDDEDEDDESPDLFPDERSDPS